MFAAPPLATRVSLNCYDFAAPFIVVLL
jgi:hypothetical protein